MTAHVIVMHVPRNAVGAAVFNAKEPAVLLVTTILPPSFTVGDLPSVSALMTRCGPRVFTFTAVFQSLLLKASRPPRLLKWGDGGSVMAERGQVR